MEFVSLALIIASNATLLVNVISVNLVINY